jgi:hypothetical protein
MRRTLLLVALAALAWPLSVRTAAAQRVELRSEVDAPSVDALRGILDAGRYQLIDRDTVIPAAARLPGDLVVVGATVRLDGTVDGSVAVLNGTLFLRPGSRVSGRIISVGSIILRSSRATMGDTISVPLDVEVSLTRAGENFTLTLDPPPPPARVKAAGLFGLAPPTYDRVNGLSVRAGADIRLAADTLAPSLRLSGVLRTARWSPGGTASLLVPLGAARLTLAAGRETMTSDRWVRGDFENSVAALFVRSDARDYYDADFASLTLARRPAPPLIAGEAFVTPRVEVRVERDRSLRAHHVFTFFGDSAWRANPPVAEGKIASVVPGLGMGWRGQTANARLDARFELGRFMHDSWSDGTGFAQLVADGEWGMVALWGHTLGVRAHLLQPVGSAVVPPQRWSSLGRPVTLPTLGYDALRGDHLVFVESAYDIPIPRLALPLLGVPTLGLRDAVGSAWVSHEESPRWTQNVGAGVRFSFLYLYLYLDPSGSHDTALNWGVSLP